MSDEQAKLAAQIRKHVQLYRQDAWIHTSDGPLPEALAADLIAAGWVCIAELGAFANEVRYVLKLRAEDDDFKFDGDP